MNPEFIPQQRVPQGTPEHSAGFQPRDYQRHMDNGEVLAFPTTFLHVLDMKVLIEQDMEGCAGVLDWGRVLKQSGNLPWAQRVMTDEVNAAVEGAIAAGAEEVLVLESHEFLRDRLHPKALLAKQRVPDVRFEADALFFVGRHAMSGVQDGILNHTGSGRSIREVRVNGRAFGELGLIAAWFGAQGVPTALVTGDEAACREAREFFDDVETVAVKRGTGCHEGVSLSAPEANRLIREAAEKAVRRISDFQPFVVEGPVRLEIEFSHSEVVDWICRIPGLARPNAHTTVVETESFADALRMYYAQGAMLWRFDAY